MKYPKSLHAEVKKNLARLEKVTKKKLGDAKDPLLVSVRSGSARSMPGMMETILNLGLNSKSVEALARNTKNERFAWDAYRRFVQMYSTVVIGLPKEELEEKLRDMKARRGVKDDTQVPAEGWRELVAAYKEHFKTKTGKDFPEDPEEQLWGAIGAVFGSWNAEKAVTYRRVERITGLAGNGRQRRANGIRQYRRQFRHGRLLYSRPVDRGKNILWRFPDQCARRGRGCGNPDADAPQRNGDADAESLQAA